MFSFQPATATASSAQAAAQRVFQSVSVNMPGRLMLANHEEYSCTVTEMSPGDALMVCEGAPALQERIIAYIDQLGRIEGHVLQKRHDGFLMSINATDRKREKLAAQLTWLANRHELGLPEDRRHDRLTPRVTRAELTLEDGRRYSCRLLDLSLSGAAVDVEMRPDIGTPVRLNEMRGRIVRHFAEGVAIEFATVQTRESLRAFL
ncbi:PilZ domain-containing protein [Rhizobium oryzicola]|uniref:PilZ domain-containing protein n=1 Tax=Rhizobium oryzicola TaxID=1232668 RepID=A0ABT8SZ46_9HYPH|nr:PilZ domain-containing protein [Rhizobium oryzicola]MDO1583727.1 PilZ domain-containing protein [Rhizobium oryzicola]